MAAASSFARTCGIPVSVRASIWEEPGVVRARRGAGHVGVSSIGDNCVGRRERPAQITLLSDLISKSAGDQANDLAATLLDRFGTIVNVLRQTEEKEVIAALVGPEVAARLVYLGVSLEQSLREEAIQGLQLGSLEAVTQYLQACMPNQNCEMFRAFFLDGENRLLDDRIMWVGTVDRVQAHPRELVRAALSLGAVAVLIAHNHVSAPPRPSNEDLPFYC